PLGLAPTASTTAALAMGDALAVVLLEEKNFSLEDFRFFHPGGSLGKRLSAKVKEVMHPVKTLSLVTPKTKLKTILPILAETNILWVVSRHRLHGIIDEKAKSKLLLRDKTELKQMCVQDVLMPGETVQAETPLCDAFNIMRQQRTNVLAVVNQKGHFIGAVFLQDLLDKVSVSFTQG
ncbi:MAG: CBS domain-containing protein, partial [Candidatus Desulfofervidaceae bacterium]|nr:CBS domain-containing protein [Candidatus Desulfofervidaceae bacterium]